MNTATLDLPEIKPDMVAPPAPAAVEQTSAITEGMTAVKGEVAKFDKIAAGLAAIEKAHPKDVIVADIHTKAGRKVAEEGWRAYRNPRLEVEKARKAAKAPVLALGKAIDTFAGGLEDRLSAGEKHYKAQIDAEDARAAEVARLAAEAEAQRVAEIREHITVIRGYLAHCEQLGMTSERIANGIAALESLVIDHGTYAEFEHEALKARDDTLAAMWRLHTQAAGREQEAARQEAIRLENERIAAELKAERERIAAEAAAIRRQAEELAAQRAESERMERLAEERRARLAAEAQAEAAAAVGVVAAPGQYPPAVEPHAGLMLQDVDRGLSIALATKPDAMLHAREAAAAIIGTTTNPMEIRAAFEADDTPPEPKPAQLVTIVATPDMAEKALTSPLKLAQELEHAHALLRDALALAEHAASAFSCKFPSQPKPSVEWWAGLKERAGTLTPKLLMTLAQQQEAA